MKITGANRPSRSRRKVASSYNTIFNSGYKRNNYLKYHPYAHRKSVNPEFASVASFAVSATSPTTTRAPLSSTANREITGTADEFKIQSYYVIEETTNIELEAQSFEEVVNEAEDGELLAIECVCNSPAITVEIVTYGLGNSPNIINNYSMIEMLRRGRGMTPAEVELLPNGRSKDPSGTPTRYYPYLARYKDDDLIDHLEDERRWFVFRYEPSSVMPYTSVIINLKNTGVESNKIVDSINIHRRIYGSPFAEGLAGTPIDEASLITGEEEITDPPATSLADLPPPPANPPPGSGNPPVNASPLVESLFARQRELEEYGPMPEIIESDDDNSD
jgi:hypothetical protein